MKILVAEPMAEAGLDLLRAQSGWDVVVSNPKDYMPHLADADALLVRSAVKVNADLLSKAPRLRVVGRAGVGVDNVDLDAATRAGVLVMNTPGGNAVAVAEHTLGLMISMARSIPQAVASTKGGQWEKKRFMGTELRGKTLGVLGLGSVGREVVRRAQAFEMRVITSDQHVNRRVAEDLGVAIVSPGEFYAQSDYVSLHAALTPETNGLLDESAFEQMKKGVHIVNCARGELIDSEALCKAVESGKVAGAALDVFQKEPPPAGDPLLALDQVLATPHIGGSTREAQEMVGIRIADQVLQYLRDGIAIHALNVPELTVDQYRTSVPYAALAERLGSFAARISNGRALRIGFIYRGRLAGQNTSLIRSAGLAGLLSTSLARKVNVVNAVQIAEERAPLFRTPGRKAWADGFGTVGTGNGRKHHVSGRRAGSGQASPVTSRWHSLRGASRRPSDVPEERRRSGRDRLCRFDHRRKQHQHRLLLARPSGCAASGCTAGGGCSD
ncbi:MAG: NAD(P)-dependent oxidoreductase [Bryobacteraceae bacterium]|jgi:D-3-phosphoglycerate dehydrogenase